MNIQSISMVLCGLINITLLILPIMSEIIRNVPDGGVGPLLVSEDDDASITYDTSRIAAYFEQDCLNDNEDNTVQQENVKSLITSYPCLIQLLDTNFAPSGGVYSLTFFDIGDCINDDVSIDYNDLCIYMFTYEQVFEVDDLGINEINLDAILGRRKRNKRDGKNNEDICVCQDLSGCSTPGNSPWGLDQIDGLSLDDQYCYPNSYFDNEDGVDLHIIDSGVYKYHQEFAGNPVIYINSGLGTGPTDSTHGTHVGGTAGGINYGTSKHLIIWDYPVCTSTGCPTCNIVMALQQVYLILIFYGRQGVINLSLGGASSFPLNFIFNQYFYLYQQLGSIAVVAAGNSDDDACDYMPAFSTYAITVGAVSQDLTKAEFSNWGDCVDIWAPGVNVVSSIIGDPYNLPLCSNCYGSLHGTSMASPHIAGIVANMLWLDNTLTFDQILYKLKLNGKRITGDECDYSYYHYNKPCIFPFFNTCSGIHNNEDICENIESCNNYPCKSSEVKNCKVYQEYTGCTECEYGYFKKDFNHQCSNCKSLFGDNCEYCSDWNGCTKCKDGCTSHQNECGLFYCDC